MEEEQDYHMEQQALSVLTLFPLRENTPPPPSLQQYSKLAESLTCGLCLSIIMQCSLLRCSHRFCRDCLERYLKNQRRACPTCRNIPGKGEPRLDAMTDALILAAFGDVRKLSKRLKEIEPQSVNLTVTVDLRRAQSVTEIKAKPQRENAEEVMVSLTALKRAKTADIDEVRPKKRSQKRMKPALTPLSSADIEKEGTPLRRSKTASESKQIKKQPFVQMSQPAPYPAIIIDRRKRRSVMVIQIQSSQPAEVQEIPREEFNIDQKDPPQVLQQTPVPQFQPSVSIIPQVSEIDSIKKIHSVKDLSKEDQTAKNQPRQEMAEDIGQEMVQEQVPQVGGMQIEAQQPLAKEQPLSITISPQVMAAREALHQQFGTNYLSKILQLSEFPVFIRVSVARHPTNPFTPLVSFSQLKLLARSAAHCVALTIADQLNVARDAIRLFVCEQLGGSFIEVASSTKLQEINNRFWRTCGGFEIGEFGEYGGMLTESEGFEGRYGSAWNNRVLYYFVDYTKLVI